MDALHAHSTVIIAIDRPLRREPDLPQRLTGYLGAAVEVVLASVAVNHLLVEGGATAAALIRRFGWDRLHVLEGTGARRCLRAGRGDGQPRPDHEAGQLRLAGGMAILI